MGRANGSRDARQLYEAMHWGKPAGRAVPCFGPRNVPRELAQLGTFVDVELDDGRIFPPQGASLSGPVLLCVSVQKGRRRDLWLVGKAGFMPGAAMPTGRIAAISYAADKNDGVHVYRHEFEDVHPCLELDRDGHVVIRRRGSKYGVDWPGVTG